jgi:hypothetical protein
LQLTVSQSVFVTNPIWGIWPDISSRLKVTVLLYLNILLHAILKRLYITQSVNNATNCSFFFHFHF